MAATLHHPEWLELFRDAVLERGHTRNFRANAEIVQEGEPSESLYWIISGELVAYMEDEDGHVLELNRMGPGEYFGELLFAHGVRTASVRTVTPARLCRIGRADLEVVLTEKPVLAMEIIRMLSTRLASLASTARGLALTDVYSRLEQFLTSHAEPDGARMRLDGISQQQMAEKLGASRSMINRVLKDLETGKYIEIQRRCIYLLKPLPKKW